MKRSFFGLSVVAVVLAGIATIAVADDAKEAAIKKQRKQLAGTWRVVECVIDGIKLAEEDAKKLTVVNGADGTWRLRSEDQVISKGTSTIDPTKKPKTIDFTKTEGEGKGDRYLGIYEIGETTRKLCFVTAEKERPTEFTSTSGSERFLVTFERVKAK
jgi:uncharacterized protein (TIGR03067 family)